MSDARTTPEPVLASRDLERRVSDAVAAIRSRTRITPAVGVTLGSGLGGAIDAFDNAVIFQTAELPHWPRSTVPGHAGRLAIGTWRGVSVAALSGRSHRYEGYPLDRVTFGVRVMHALGARVMLFTNAVGAIHPELSPGDLMLATDHVNFIGKRGLFAPSELPERRAGRRYGPTYSARLGAALIAAAPRAGVTLARGVLMGGHGPTYETAAEVRMASALGADVACMSTVHEVTVAAELGCEAASVSCVTNRATGLSDTLLSHEEVGEVAGRVAGRLRALIEAFLDGERERTAGR
jgi:purine-nucleoside phosphorylase